MLWSDQHLTQIEPFYCNYSGTTIFEHNTDFIGLILKPEKFEYLILKFNNPMISMNYVYKNSGITKSSKKSYVISIG